MHFKNCEEYEEGDEIWIAEYRIAPGHQFEERSGISEFHSFEAVCNWAAQCKFEKRDLIVDSVYKATAEYWDIHESIEYKEHLKYLRKRKREADEKRRETKRLAKEKRDSEKEALKELNERAEYERLKQKFEVK